MKLSVVLACYNEEDTLADQLEGLAAQRWHKPWEVLFVDNCSTDGSYAIAESYRRRVPNLRLIKAHEKQGKSFALNKGIRLAHSDAIAIVDADDQVAPGWLPAIGKALERHELVATRTDVETLNTSANRQTRGDLQDAGLLQIDYPPYLPHASGGTVGVRRSLHERIGGFDETLHCLEDTDYLWRAQLAGARLRFVPDAVMRVRFRQELVDIYRQRKTYAEYNVLLSKRYSQYGDPMPDPWLTYFNGWKQLLRSMRKLRRRPSRAAWVGRFGWMVGRTLGVLKYRVPPV